MIKDAYVLQLTAEQFRAAFTKEQAAKGAKHRDMEHRLQVSCVRWFRFAYPHLARLLFAVPNGGDRDIRVARRLKAEGVVAGVADLLLLVARGGKHGLALEIKTAKGRQSASQRAWQLSVERHGYKYRICRSVDEFREVVDEYML